MEALRRTLLKGAAAALAAAMMWPSRVLAAEWDKALFDIADSAAVLRAYGAAARASSTATRSWCSEMIT